MLQPRVKQIEIGARKFELRRLSPEVGTFILMRMMGVQMRDQPAVPVQTAPATADKPPAVEISGETRVRVLSFVVFSGAIGFEDFKFIQQHCMRCVALISETAGESFPMPIVSDGGEWTKDGQAIADDVGLVMKLTTEVLILCFADFFEAGATGL